MSVNVLYIELEVVFVNIGSHSTRAIASMCVCVCVRTCVCVCSCVCTRVYVRALQRLISHLGDLAAEVDRICSIHTKVPGKSSLCVCVCVCVCVRAHVRLYQIALEGSPLDPRWTANGTGYMS